MADFLQRYQSGEYEQVWADLLVYGSHIRDEPLWSEARAVVRETMRRVRFNIDMLIPRLETMGYLFRKGGFWENVSAEKRTRVDADSPIFQPPPSETSKRLAALERVTGSLPLSLACWFEEVGCVHLIGLFPSNERGYGPVLDPLYVESLETVLQVVTRFVEIGGWEEEPLLPLAPDRFHKYGYSGGGSYSILLPCKAVDAPLVNEPHQTTFVNYLRLCLKWGGFPGLERECRLAPEELAFLTQYLLPF